MIEQTYVAKQGWALWECGAPLKSVHVAPETGPEHTLNKGVVCWCKPRLENAREAAMGWEIPLVIHNRPQ